MTADLDSWRSFLICKKLEKRGIMIINLEIDGDIFNKDSGTIFMFDEDSEIEDFRTMLDLSIKQQKIYPNLF